MAVEVQEIHTDTPHKKLILHAVKILERGGVVVYPTDTIYGLAADIFRKDAIERILKIKKVAKNKLMSLIFPDLKNIGDWVHLSNPVYRVMKRVLPGKYTFILPASKDIPKAALQKRRTLGIRVPDNEVCRRLVEELGRPLLSTSVPKSEAEDDFFTNPDEIAERYKNEIDLILDAGIMPYLLSTVVDFSVEPPEIIREGAGDVNALF
jgi:tRNA threonylcarbamoyl adenosine modification protein (Sua5/YciO/YrdC/YwlC family)